MPAAANLTALLQKHAALIGPIFTFDLNSPSVCRLDFSATNVLLQHAALENTVQFQELVQHLLNQHQATAGVGGYFENRVIYRRSALFGGANENRTVHLGVDVWVPAFTSVLAPLPGWVHSFQDNQNFGDYGPTIILEHRLEEIPFYTLYGHLTRQSLQGLTVGQAIPQGTAFTRVGPYPENGDWPPHLHFQVMTDMLGRHGDFPGVGAPGQQEFYREICLNPNLLLQCKYLD